MVITVDDLLAFLAGVLALEQESGPQRLLRGRWVADLPRAVASDAPQRRCTHIRR